ncbi:TonB-dependent vitamin B12 receptor [Pseudoxanthomonas sp. SGNA-20]|uniref:TonB-dependent vitamin B12 receptor n=1 Tax=Pseudoxanthomonas sp. SGNA-20 TaxID=2493088 RepID=UPI000F642A8A|nr:TonB-dependent vitamin B12 receptor [Pseudoxanthomonas sp. SGNA-20]RRN56340.1 TonB-dependent vitamin B12 receptor [Pseudoxanthomonas sp. SGNA-20]
MKPFPFRPLCLAVAAALAPASACALEAATDLDEVVVTATRTVQSVHESLVPVQVIDRATIERSQAGSLQDLLRGRAGVNLSNQGGHGKVSALMLRGTESDHVLMLVDGMRIGAASNGMPALQDIPLDQVERIEIVRGPRSSLYGPEAIGGVIQVFTRGAGKGLRQDLRLGVGSHALREANAGLSWRGERGWVSARAGHREEDGFDACRGTAAGWGAGCYVDEPDRDGHRNNSLNLRAGTKLGEDVELQAHLLDSDSRNEYDGGPYSGNEADNLQQVAGARLDWRLGERVSLQAQAGRTRDDAEGYYRQDGARRLVNSYRTRRDLASLQLDAGFGAGQLFSAGLDWQDDRVSSSAGFERGRRDNLGAFVEYQGRFGAHSLQASARNDDNAQFGNHATGSLGYGLALGETWRLSASAGTGFKAPTFNDLYYPGFSNPLLEPEESRSVNLGVHGQGEGWSLGVDVFQTRIDELIGYDTGFNLVNIDRARIRGAELTAATALAGFDLALELSWLDPRNDSDGLNDGNWLPRRARRSGRIDLDRRFGAFAAGLTVSGAGRRYDDVANTTRLGGYGLLDLRLEWTLSPAWTVQAKASNVFDRQYETVAWYNQPGREYALALQYRTP